MLLIVKEQNYKSYIKKGILYTLLVGMFFWYYNHMSSEFQKMNTKLETELAKKEKILNNRADVSKKVERIIYKEAEKCVELLGQEKIKSVKVIKDRLYITCDYNTDVEPLFIRYGIMALVKSSPEDIKISVNLKFIVESNYEI